jgi:hypothetical protein
LYFKAVGFGGRAGIAVPAGEFFTAPIMVGVPLYGPWLVTPVTSLLTRGGTALVAPGIAVTGRSAMEAARETAELYTLGSWL